VAMTEQRDMSATDIAVRRGNVPEGALGLNLVAHAPRKLAGEIEADYKTRKQVDARKGLHRQMASVKCELLQPAQVGGRSALYLREATA